MTAISSLSQDPLSQEVARLMALLSQKEQLIASLQHQLHLFRTARFGRKSEKGVVPEQMSFHFNEAEPLVESKQEEAPSESQTITYMRTKNKTGRKPLPQSLPYVGVF